MIGQKNNLKLIDTWKTNNNIPRTIIISGKFGSGRKTLAKEIFSLDSFTRVFIDELKKQNLLDLLTISSENTTKTVYIINGVNNASNKALSSLLKTIEEPPKNAYFVLICDNLNFIPDTIISRSTVLGMENYSLDDLKKINPGVSDIVLNYSSTPYDVLNINTLEIEKTENFVKVVLKCDKVHELLRLTTKLKNKKEDADKIDCDLFLNIFIDCAFKNNMVDFNKLSIIQECIDSFRLATINKKNAVEVMLIKLLVEND